MNEKRLDQLIDRAEQIHSKIKVLIDYSLVKYQRNGK